MVNNNTNTSQDNISQLLADNEYDLMLETACYKSERDGGVIVFDICYILSYNDDQLCYNAIKEFVRLFEASMQSFAVVKITDCAIITASNHHMDVVTFLGPTNALYHLLNKTFAYPDHADIQVLGAKLSLARLLYQTLTIVNHHGRFMDFIFINH